MIFFCLWTTALAYVTLSNRTRCLHTTAMVDNVFSLSFFLGNVTENGVFLSLKTPTETCLTLSVEDKKVGEGASQVPLKAQESWTFVYIGTNGNNRWFLSNGDNNLDFRMDSPCGGPLSIVLGGTATGRDFSCSSEGLASVQLETLRLIGSFHSLEERFELQTQTTKDGAEVCNERVEHSFVGGLGTFTPGKVTNVTARTLPVTSATRAVTLVPLLDLPCPTFAPTPTPPTPSPPTPKPPGAQCSTVTRCSSCARLLDCQVCSGGVCRENCVSAGLTELSRCPTPAPTPFPPPPFCTPTNILNLCRTYCGIDMISECSCPESGIAKRSCLAEGPKVSLTSCLTNCGDLGVVECSGKEIVCGKDGQRPPVVIIDPPMSAAAGPTFVQPQENDDGGLALPWVIVLALVAVCCVTIPAVVFLIMFYNKRVSESSAWSGRPHGNTVNYSETMPDVGPLSTGFTMASPTPRKASGAMGMRCDVCGALYPTEQDVYLHKQKRHTQASTSQGLATARMSAMGTTNADPGSYNALELSQAVTYSTLLPDSNPGYDNPNMHMQSARSARPTLIVSESSRGNVEPSHTGELTPYSEKSNAEFEIFNPNF